MDKRAAMKEVCFHVAEFLKNMDDPWPGTEADTDDDKRRLSEAKVILGESLFKRSEYYDKKNHNNNH